MAHWMTIQEISERYAVEERRLLEYSHRGNLSMRRVADGSLMFDEAGVARIFRRRDALVASGVRRGEANLGVVGLSRLGVNPAPAALSAWDERRRALRVTGT